MTDLRRFVAQVKRNGEAVPLRTPGSLLPQNFKPACYFAGGSDRERSRERIRSLMTSVWVRRSRSQKVFRIFSSRSEMRKSNLFMGSRFILDIIQHNGVYLIIQRIAVS